MIYQVYPRSFADANGDGVGDLLGIISKLDYLEWLGVDAVWLSPFYPSPMVDFGYDVADYCDVDPLFGTLEDFDELVEETRKRGIRTIIDLVPNHTSNKHPWFVESRSSRDNPRRSWYVWCDPAPDGGPPNNWESFHTGESAWEWDEQTGQYYLHTFQVEQPDLNWQNPEVREAMYEVMRFWLDRGVAGFRIDALTHAAKDLRFRDNPPNPDWKAGDPVWKRQIRAYSEDRPEIMDIVREMRTVADKYEGDRVLIGEMYLPLERLMEYYGTEQDGLHLPFNFALLRLSEWEPEAVGTLVEAYEAALPENAWPNWVLGNHDNPRIASRIGPTPARAAQMLLLTLRGTPTCYYGDEIGQQDVDIPPDKIQDPQGVHDPDYNRDPARTPMQWTAGANAGYGPETVEPWLPVAEDYDEVNVETQQSDPCSMLALFRRLVTLRRELPALTVGSYRSLNAGNSSILAYLREHGGQRVLVVLNFGSEDQVLDLSEAGEKGEVLCSTLLDRNSHLDLAELKLRPNEGLLLEPKSDSAEHKA